MLKYNDTLYWRSSVTLSCWKYVFTSMETRKYCCSLFTGDLVETFRSYDENENEYEIFSLTNIERAQTSFI